MIPLPAVDGVGVTAAAVVVAAAAAYCPNEAVAQFLTLVVQRSIC